MIEYQAGRQELRGARIKFTVGLRLMVSKTYIGVGGWDIALLVLIATL